METNEVKRTGVIGLGAMGLQMARHLRRKGFDVTGYTGEACNLAPQRATYCSQNPLRRNDFEHTLRHAVTHHVTWRNTSRRNPAIT
jgi:prephenate dehydrogenase